VEECVSDARGAGEGYNAQDQSLPRNRWRRQGWLEREGGGGRSVEQPEALAGFEYS
jgi:hypothetical protein